MKYIVFCITLLTCFFAETVYVFSCGAEPDPFDYYTNFYNPNLPANPGFEPFYYTALSNYYGVEEPEEQVNLREWDAFFSGKATVTDIREFIYNYSRQQMTVLYNHIEKGTPLTLPANITNNTLTKYFSNSKDRETLGYLMYAKQCEAHTGSEDVWNAPAPDSLTMIRLARNGIQLYNACKDLRIKERFAFQVTRMAHYSKSFRLAAHYYDSLAAPIPSSSLIHYKALALKAGALLRIGKKAESAYLFSHVFEGAPSQRKLAYLNTGWTGADEKAVLALCAGNTEKAAVATMYAFRTIDFNPDGLRKVYRFDPKTPMLDVLLSREINKLEENYLHNVMFKDLTGSSDEGYWALGAPADAGSVKALQMLVDSIAAAGKVREPALWQVSSAYLSFMLKDFAGAHSRLAVAKASIKRPALADQWEIVQLLVNINEQPRIDKDFENKLLASFRWLDTKLPKEQNFYDGPENNERLDGYFYTRMYRNLLDYVVVPRYIRQNDDVRQALIMTRRDSVYAYGFYWNAPSGKHFIEDSLHTDQLLALYELYNSRNKTPFEKYLCSHLRLNSNELGEIIAVNYVRQHDFSNAVTWFKRSGSSRKSELVFYAQLEDFGYEYADSMTNSISQLEYATRMVELEKKMKGKKVDPEVYFEYATGLFSISYYGHSYHFSVNYRPSTWWFSNENERNPFLREYFGCYRAEEYYKKAADAATDPEFKAKALFLAARCAQKHMPPGDDWWYPATYQNPYFPILLKDYKKTAFFEEARGRCSYLRDYVNAQPQTNS